jgi:hypothetical protein
MGKIITVQNLSRFTTGTKKKRNLLKYSGLCWRTDYGRYGKGTILVDPNQNQRAFLNTCIHEMLHNKCPGWTETRIKEVANFISRGIWEQGYRKEL